MAIVENVNLVAVVVAAIVAMIVGFVWYSKPLFGDMWMKQMKINQKEMQKMRGKAMVIASIAALLTACVLAVLMKSLGATTITAGLTVAFWIWVGFFLTLEMVRMAFEGTSMSLFLISIFHHIVALSAMSIVLVLIP